MVPQVRTAGQPNGASPGRHEVSVSSAHCSSRACSRWVVGIPPYLLVSRTRMFLESGADEVQRQYERRLPCTTPIKQWSQTARDTPHSLVMAVYYQTIISNIQIMFHVKHPLTTPLLVGVFATPGDSAKHPGDGDRWSRSLPTQVEHTRPHGTGCVHNGYACTMSRCLVLLGTPRLACPERSSGSRLLLKH